MEGNSFYCQGSKWLVKLEEKEKKEEEEEESSKILNMGVPCTKNLWNKDSYILQENIHYLNV